MLLSTDLEECIKWEGPVYTLNETNLIGIGAFKNHCAIWFFQGSVLIENTELLINAQENKTKNLRQIRFNKADKIKLEELKKYVLETIYLFRNGITVKSAKRTQEVKICLELKNALENYKDTQKSFLSLTPGKQREFNEYIAEAKRETTKQSRLVKILPMIMQGIGLNDKYNDC